jgi:hypothetical protein
VGELTAAPDLDGWTIVERLLKDLAPLEDRIWLVIDDVHELGPAEARSQLELLTMRAPPELRFALATRHDLRLGLHRLRLEGELTEIRAADLRFTDTEARELLEAAGVKLAEPTLATLYERTEGWAAGLRLAALSLAGHPDPERFAAEFSGSERTRSSWRWTRRGPGSVTTTCSPTCCGWSCGVPRRLRSPRSIRWLSAGTSARVPDRGGPARPSGAGLGASRPVARRPLVQPGLERAGRDRACAPGRVSRRGPRRGCRAGRGHRG